MCNASGRAHGIDEQRDLGKASASKPDSFPATSNLAGCTVVKMLHDATRS